MRSLLALSSSLVLASLCLFAQVQPPPEGAPMTPALRRLLDDGGRVERVVTNFRFADGTLWIDDALVFTDRPRNRVVSWKPGEEPAVVMEDSGGAAGLAIDDQGRLVLAERTGRRVSRREDGELQALASQVGGAPLFGPTDVAVGPDGSVYVADPPASGARATARGRVLRIDAANAVTVAADFLVRPTGVALSPDGGRLYVADAGRREVRVYELGTTKPSRTLTSVVPWKRGIQGSADGITVDKQGRLFLAGPGGIWVIDANGGRLGVIATPETPSSSAFGDADGRTLYIAAETSIYKVRFN
jgi:sugar lactone lactonase YvrE